MTGKSIYDLYSTDSKLEEDGINVDFGDYGIFVVARSGGANEKFLKAIERKSRPYRRQIDSGDIDLDIMNRLIMETMAESVILNWSGVKGRDGKNLKFSPETCLKLFEDLPDLYAALRDESQKLANYRALEIEEDSKN